MGRRREVTPPGSICSRVKRCIMREAAPNDYRWSALILGIVKSQPFQMRVAPAPASATTVASKSDSGPKETQR